MRYELYENIEKSLKSFGISVIKAPTGAGKTYACLQAVKQSERQCIMALPNARLMKEVEYKANEMGVFRILLLKNCLTDFLRSFQKKSGMPI